MNTDEPNREEYLNKDRNDIELTNPVAQNEKHDPAMDEPVDLGDEERAGEITSANQEIEIAHGEDPRDGDIDEPLSEADGPEHSIDEHMPAGSESAEDKANDLINSGIIWM